MMPSNQERLKIELVGLSVARCRLKAITVEMIGHKKDPTLEGRFGEAVLNQRVAYQSTRRELEKMNGPEREVWESKLTEVLVRTQ